MSGANIPLIESKLTEVTRLILEAQTILGETLESLEDSEERSTEAGIKRLFDSAGSLIGATNRERILVKHGESAPKTAQLVRR